MGTASCPTFVGIGRESRNEREQNWWDGSRMRDGFASTVKSRYNEHGYDEISNITNKFQVLSVAIRSFEITRYNEIPYITNLLRAPANFVTSRFYSIWSSTCVSKLFCISLRCHHAKLKVNAFLNCICCALVSSRDSLSSTGYSPNSPPCLTRAYCQSRQRNRRDCCRTVLPEHSQSTVTGWGKVLQLIDMVEMPTGCAQETLWGGDWTSAPVWPLRICKWDPETKTCLQCDCRRGYASLWQLVISFWSSAVWVERFWFWDRICGNRSNILSVMVDLCTTISIQWV